jgi:hypothetical protein
MERFKPSLEGPGSERRLKAIRRRFRAASAKGRRNACFPIVVIGVFLASGLASWLLLRLV